MKVLQTVKGSNGEALDLEVPDDPTAVLTVCTWLVTAPSYHPFWSQYMVAVARLRDEPGFPSPILKVPGATHELIVIALDPEHGPYTAENMDRYMPGGEAAGRLPNLEPINVTHQFVGTDEEAKELAHLSAWGIVNGHLNPETADAPEYIRAQWKDSLTKTLAHMRGEPHES